MVSAGGLVVAAATLVALSAASEANGHYQQAVRGQIRYTAATVSNARKVYVDEAPLALAINASRFRADELERHAGPGDWALLAEAKAERATAEEYIRRFSAAQGPINDLIEPGSGTGAPRLGRRLAALQAGNGQMAMEVQASLAAGDRAGQRVVRAVRGTMAGVVIAMIGFVLWWRQSLALRGVRIGAAAGKVLARSRERTSRLRAIVRSIVRQSISPQRSTRGRSALPGSRSPEPSPTMGRPGTAAAEPPAVDFSAEAALPDVPFLPPDMPVVTPHDSSAIQDSSPSAPKWSPFPVILLGLTAAVVTSAQIQAGANESRLLADAARRADVVAGMVTGGLIRDAFVHNGKQTGLLLGQRADELEEAGGSPAQAAADEAAAERIIQLTADIGVQPSAADGVDAFTSILVSGLHGEAESMLADQRKAAEAAAAAGKRSDYLVFMLFALTIAATSIEIVRFVVARRPSRAARHTVSAITGATVLAALTAVLVV